MVYPSLQFALCCLPPPFLLLHGSQLFPWLCFLDLLYNRMKEEPFQRLSTGLMLPGAARFVEPRGCHYVVKLVLGGSVGEMSFILRLLGLPSQGTLVSNFLSANHNYWDREKNNPGPVLVLPAVVLKEKA